MAKFKFVYWLYELLISKNNFIFNWDKANSTKSEDKHGVIISMVESSFLDDQLLALGEQYQPEVSEDRYGIIAKCSTNEILFICFTIRTEKIRTISARLANKKERMFYES